MFTASEVATGKRESLCTCLVVGVRRPTIIGIAAALTMGGCGGEETTGPPEGEPPPAVASVSVSPSTATLTSIDEAVSLIATASDASGTAISGKTFTWSSSDETVATVSSSDATVGNVLALANGNATINASTDGVDGSATITVSQVVTGIRVMPFDENIMLTGETLQFTGEPSDDFGHPVAGETVDSWDTSDPSVATVDATGLVTAVGLGFASITASSGGSSGNGRVEVVPATAFIASRFTVVIEEEQLLGGYALVEFEFAQDNSELSYRLHTFNTVDMMEAHIHLGDLDNPGPVEATIFGPSAATTVDGVLSEGIILPSDLQTLGGLADLVAEIRGSGAYVDVHTTADPSGAYSAVIGPPPLNTFIAQLDGAQVVPTVTTTGTALVELQIKAGGTIDVANYRLSANMTGITQIHIHLGAAGFNTPVEVVIFDASEGTPLSGTVADDFSQGHLETLASIADLLAALRSGGAYIDIHSSANPDGELRGQFGPSPDLRP